MRIIGIVLFLGSITFGAVMYTQSENFDPEGHSIYSGGNGTFTSVEKIGGMSVYIETDSMTCVESDVEIYKPSTSDDSFWAGTSWFNDDCDSTWDVPGWTYIGLLANSVDYDQGQQNPKLTGGTVLTVETNVDILVADHGEEDEAFGRVFLAIPGIFFGFILIAAGSDDEIDNSGVVPQYTAMPITGQHGGDSQFTMPSDNQFGMNPTSGQEKMSMDYTDQFR